MKRRRTKGGVPGMASRPPWMPEAAWIALVREHTRRTPERARRSTSAGAAKRAGQWFERELEDGPHHFYAVRGEAVLQRVHPPVAGAPGAMRPSGRGPVDFAGTLCGGQSVWLDAKATKGHRSFNIRDENAHQLDRLMAAAGMGAFAFFLVTDYTRDLAFIVRDFASLAVRKPVKLESRGALVVPVPVRPLRPDRPPYDWLPVVRRLIDEENPYAPE